MLLVHGKLLVSLLCFLEANDFLFWGDLCLTLIIQAEIKVTAAYDETQVCPMAGWLKYQQT